MSLHEDIYPSLLQFKVQTDVQCRNVGCSAAICSPLELRSYLLLFRSEVLSDLQMQQPVATSVKFHRGWKILPCCLMNN